MFSTGRGLWLLTLLFGVGSKSIYAATTFIAPRQDDGDSDSDSDSDSGSESESCSNGVCTICHDKVCTTTTRGPKATSTLSITGARTDASSTSGDHHFTATTAHSTKATNLRGSGTSANATATNTNSSSTAKHGLSTGGIVGLVIGLLILAGLLAMIILKRRSQILHKRKRPKGTTLLTANTPSNTESALFNNIGNGRSGSEMTESTFSPGVIHSAADGILSANHSGHPAPQPYDPSNSVVADNTHSDRSRPVPSNMIDAIVLSEISSLPSPHEPGFEPVQSDSASAPVTTNPQSRSPPGLPSSTMHADLVSFQKDLESHHEKRNRPSGSGDAEAVDPPPVYTD